MPAPAHAPPPARSNLLGILATIGAGAQMISSDALARAAAREIPLGEAIAGRGFVACIILGLAAVATSQLRWTRAVLSVPVVIRILAETGSGMLFIGAISKVPIANATAILQFIPLVTMLAASVLFAERVGWRRWLAGFVGLLGVLLILKPGTDGFTLWSLLAVGAMLCMATRDLATSRITKGVPTLLIGTLTAAVAGSAGLLLLGLTSPFLVPSGSTALLTLGSGIMLSGGFICLVFAARNAEMSAVAPFRYFTLLWALLIGYFAWGQVPDAVAVLGIAIVVASGLYAFSRERLVARRARAAAATAAASVQSSEAVSG